MQKIDIQGRANLSLANSWTLPALLGGLEVSYFFTTHEVRYFHLAGVLFLCLVIFFYKRTSKNSFSHNGWCLEFGDTVLTCKYKDTLFWHIPYHRLSHITREAPSRYSWLVSQNSSTLIHTNDGDSYSIPVQISEQNFQDIQQSLTQVITQAAPHH